MNHIRMSLSRNTNNCFKAQKFLPKNEKEVSKEKIAKKVEEETSSNFDVDMDSELIEDELDIVVNQSDAATETIEAKETSLQEAEIELSNEVPEKVEQEKPDDFEIEVETVKEELLTDKEINKKVKEFGEYDPELDLSSYKLPPIDLLETHGQTTGININKEELEANKNKIVETLSNYKIEIDKIRSYG